MDNWTLRQKLFLITLVSLVPAIESVGLISNYEFEELQINERDYISHVKQNLKNRDLWKSLASAEGKPVEEVVKDQAEDLRRSDLDLLKKRYTEAGMRFGDDLDEINEERQALIDKSRRAENAIQRSMAEAAQHRDIIAAYEKEAEEKAAKDLEAAEAALAVAEEPSGG